MYLHSYVSQSKNFLLFSTEHEKFRACVRDTKCDNAAHSLECGPLLVAPGEWLELDAAVTVGAKKGAARKYGVYHGRGRRECPQVILGITKTGKNEL